MRFGILGPLAVTEAGQEVPITAGRDRIVLAMLLAHAGRIVTAAELVDALWEHLPPATARGQVQSCISRLRRVLPAGALSTDPAGYRLSVPDDDLDAALFVRLVGQARARAAVSAGDALKLFREALALWRGPALSGVESRAVRRRAAVLDEERAAVIEECIDLELEAGSEREIIGELTGLVERHPLREKFRLQLMLALHRLGRQADALAEYRRARAYLLDELGIEPGPALADLHRRILRGEATPSPGASQPAAPVHRLPRRVGDFVGREQALSRLLAAAARTNVLIIDGMAGSGKTTLAVQLAGMLAGDHPDAQLFLDLRGHSEQDPLEPAAALLALLRQLGVGPDRIPPDLEDRNALWQSELARRRAIVILDNAADSAQVTPLLAVEPTTLTLVTSRRRLTALDGGHPESLPVLDEDEAVALLHSIVGDRVAAEPGAARDLVRRCGRLPLAVRLAGARLAHRPRWAVTDMVQRLGASVLPELAAENRTVASAFALSYGHLTQPAQRLFRLLGLYPAGRFAAVSAAALGGLPLREAQELLDELVDLHLVEEPDPGHYRLHDLVRQYAATLAEALPEPERRSAVSGLVDLHLYAAAELNRPRESETGARVYPAGPALRPDLVERAVAEADWQEEQRPVLQALVRASVETGDPDHAWLLARVSWPFLYHRNYYDDLIAVHTEGIKAAELAGDEHGAAVLGNYLASVLYRVGRYAEALQRVGAMLEYQTRIGDVAGEAQARSNYGGILMRLGRPWDAIDCLRQSLRTWQRLGYSRGIAARNSDMAGHLIEVGRYEEALRHARLSLQGAVELGSEMFVATGLRDVGEARAYLGDFDAAERLLTVSLRLIRKGGMRSFELDIIRIRGLLEQRRGRWDRSVEWYLQGLTMARELGHTPAVAAISNALGTVLLASGDPAGAAELHRNALAIARRTGYLAQEGRALSGLAACIVRDDPAGARRYWQQALAIFHRMDVPEQEEAARRLAALGDGSGTDQLQPAPGGGRMEA